MSADPQAAVVPRPRPLDDPLLTRRALTRAQYDLLVAAGEFEGQHVELLEGAIVEMAPQGPDHSWAIARLTTRLARVVPEGIQVSPQVPLAASGLSEPEPDLYLLDEGDRVRDRHPSTALLVIEIAVTSQRTDLVHKARIYARAGVPEYWVVDLAHDGGAGRVVVHREPSGDTFATVAALPLDTPLDVLGVTVVLSEILDR